MANNVLDLRTGSDKRISARQWSTMTVEEKELFFSSLNIEQKRELCSDISRVSDIAYHQYQISVLRNDRMVTDDQYRRFIGNLLLLNVEFMRIIRTQRSVRLFHSRLSLAILLRFARHLLSDTSRVVTSSSALSKLTSMSSVYSPATLSVSLQQALQSQWSLTTTDRSAKSKQQSSKHEKRQETQENAEKGAEASDGGKKRKRNVVTFDADELVDQLKCPICLGLPSTVCTTPCGHNFCYLCISSSLFLKPECPVCRKEKICPGDLFVNSSAQWFVDQYAEQVLPEGVKTMRKEWHEEDKVEMGKS
jgi:hypothetical protein